MTTAPPSSTTPDAGAHLPATTMAVCAQAAGGPEVLQWTELPLAAPGPGEVLLRHTAIGVNFIDTYFRSGLYPWPQSPLVPGAEAAGVVEAVGADVTDWHPGDRVAYVDKVGAYAQARVLAASRLVRIPEGVDDALAASVLLKGLTVQALVTSVFPVQLGQTVLVHAAAGGVGLLLGQWLRRLGATTIGTVGSAEKAVVASQHGYDHVIDYSGGDFVAEVKQITGGRGCPVVYDSVGRDTWRGSLQCLARLGVFVSFGQSSGGVEGFGIRDLAQGSLSAVRPSLFDYIAGADVLRWRAEELFARIADGSLAAGAMQRFPLRDAGDLHRVMEQRATIGASVLIP